MGLAEKTNEINIILLKYGYIKSLCIEKQTDDYESYKSNLVLLLCEFPFDDNSKHLRIKFKNIKDLKLGDLEGILKIVIGIQDISSYQLEGIKYKVAENENEQFNFLCSSFMYEMVEYTF